jgi:hypothetical protein
MAVADGTSLTYNAPFGYGTDITIYADGSAFDQADYTYNEILGLDGMSSITFDVAPLVGVKLTATFTGNLAMRARFVDSIQYERKRGMVGYNRASVAFKSVLLDEGI